MFSLIRRIFHGDDGFSPEKRFVRDKFDFALRSNFKISRAFYTRRFGNVLNTDQAKELCPEYAKNRSDKIRFSRCVYAPAKAFIGRMYKESIKSREFAVVVFLAGGAGSGKSTALEGWKQEGRLPKDWLIVDGTLSDYEEASSQIGLALSSKIQVLLVYVYCPVEKAVRLALDRAIERGRGITIPRLAQTHFRSQQAVFRLSDDHREAPLFDLRIFDNTAHSPAASDLLTIRSNAYETLDAATQRAQAAFHHEHTTREDSGKPIPSLIYDLFAETD